MCQKWRLRQTAKVAKISFYLPLIKTNLVQNYKNKILVQSTVYKNILKFWRLGKTVKARKHKIYFCQLLFVIGFMLTSLNCQWKRFGNLFLFNLFCDFMLTNVATKKVLMLLSFICFQLKCQFLLLLVEFYNPIKSSFSSKRLSLYWRIRLLYVICLPVTCVKFTFCEQT